MSARDDDDDDDDDRDGGVRDIHRVRVFERAKSVREVHGL